MKHKFTLAQYTFLVIFILLLVFVIDLSLFRYSVEKELEILNKLMFSLAGVVESVVIIFSLALGEYFIKPDILIRTEC